MSFATSSQQQSNSRGSLTLIRVHGDRWANQLQHTIFLGCKALVFRGDFSIFEASNGASKEKALNRPGSVISAVAHPMQMARLSIRSAMLFSLLMANAEESATISPREGASPQDKAMINLADERRERHSKTIQAQELLLQGDEATRSGEYERAVAVYADARQLLPDAPVTAELRAAATGRYAMASVQLAEQKQLEGRQKEALDLLDRVLAADVSPGHVDALKLKKRIQDPIRTNPADTADHKAQVDLVEKLLREANGLKDLGEFDQAEQVFGRVLSIDATNQAARRGMQDLTQHKVQSLASSHDQARAEMLNEVESQWEIQPKFDAVVPQAVEIESGSLGVEAGVRAKMKEIVLPVIDLEKVGIEEAIDFLRTQSVALDRLESDPARKGLNLVLNVGNDASQLGKQIRGIRFDLKLRQVSLEQALKYICDATRTHVSIDEYAVNVRPVGTEATELVSRTYRVPPDFLSGDAVTSAAPAADPFAERTGVEGVLPKRMSAQEKLQSFGITFPAGASASYNPSSNSLIVRNTLSSHDLVQQLVDTMSQTEPVQVVVKVTMIKAEQSRLNELGFDWLTSGYVSGNASPVVLGGGTSGNGEVISDVPAAAGDLNPITSGNRSGTSTTQSDSIDALLRSDNTGVAANQSRAPGVISVYGQIGQTQLAMLMRGLSQKKGVDVMQKPEVVTRSGQTAKVEMIREFRYPTEYEPAQIPNSVGSSSTFIDPVTRRVIGSQSGLSPVTPAMPTAFEVKPVGTTLEVNPVVGADRGYIELSLKPVFTEFDGFINYGSPITSTSQLSLDLDGILTNFSVTGVVTKNAILQPVFSVIKADTSVTVANGATIVLGGLVKDTSSLVDDQVPILGSMPIVGRWFRSQVSQSVKKQIILLVNVQLQDPSGQPYSKR